MRIELPEGVKLIFGILETAGFEAYVVGGCVRDSLLGLRPKDWDITTNALPGVVMNLFIKHRYIVIPTGIEYGTVTVCVGEDRYEITTFRSDGEYINGRRPESVNFVGTLKDDIMRRDLTINGMAYNDKVGLVDYVNGYFDMCNKRIRFIGNTQERLNEDTLRALRAFRFWCRFGYEMDKETSNLCYTHFLNNYRLLTTERITMEIMSLFSCKNLDVDRLNIIVSLLANTVIPEILPMVDCTQKNEHHKYTVYMHTLHVMSYCSTKGDARLMFAALLHDIGKPVVKTVGSDGREHFIGHAKESYKIGNVVLCRLKVTNQFMSDVLFLVVNHDNFNTGVKIASVRRFMSDITKAQLDRWKVLRKADILAQVYTKEKEEHYQKVISIMNQVEADKTNFKLSDLKINGNDILEMGIVDKTQIKFILQDCLSNCYGSPKCNNREWLLKYASKLVKKANNQEKFKHVNDNA